VSAALEGLLVVAGVAGMLGAVTGLVLLFSPRRLFDDSSRLRRVLLEADVAAVFNRRFAIERRVYRRHRFFGIVVLLGAVAAASFAAYLSVHPRALKLQALLGRLGFTFIEVLTATLAVVLAVVGICLIMRPSVLKGIETIMNRWVEAPAQGKSHAAVLRAILRAPRIAGLLLVAAGLACLRPF
jgi:hypothetical protein